MKKLTMEYFPVAGMNVKFITKLGTTHNGRYGFNVQMARRWFDEDNNEYTSNFIDSWEELSNYEKVRIL